MAGRVGEAATHALSQARWELVLVVMPWDNGFEHARRATAPYRAQVLGLSFRARELSLAPAGLAPVAAPGVENADLSNLVRSHTDYAAQLPAVLARLRMDGVYG